MASTSGNAESDDAGVQSASSYNADELLARCRDLQEEVRQFGDHLAKAYDGYFQPDFPTRLHATFSNNLRAEVEAIRKHMESPDPTSIHHLSSSNLPFFQTVWDAAKRARGIVRLQCPVWPGPKKQAALAPGHRIILSQGSGQRKSGDSAFIIDVIADDGKSWLKVSTYSNNRLVHDCAKEGVFCGDSDEDDDDGPDADDFSDIPLVKTAQKLANTAQGYRIGTRSPTCYLILPGIFEGQDFAVDKILDICRHIGINMICGNAVPPAPLLSESVLSSMVPGPKAKISKVLNMDTSILIALASEFSNMKFEDLPSRIHRNKTHIDHAHLERKEPFLAQILLVLSDRELVCTKEAAAALSHIVNTIGTDAENARAHLLLNVDPTKTREQRIAELQGLSVHRIPACLQLPIRIVGMDDDDCQARFTAPIKECLAVLLNPARSVFSYGWAKSFTTVTCNGVAVKQLERDLEMSPTLELEWPSVWVIATSRPLVGIPRKAGFRRVRKHIGDCRITCTCGVEKLYASRSDVTIL
ncbi:Uu.00g052830.m01.CDS01 [Anthostomella pinea]|uniref:Uu.00g052830.m01.CDS01 n=1 Tax=Anthostomella pinea TaxID=933095 RepID=A0AAI8VXI8_9PEZI|nr:Uu.00g052830.m01.CDS01 [Anthostomella pinea]